jgi:Skp family chaperone for outer membrane proteins
VFQHRLLAAAAFGLAALLFSPHHAEAQQILAQNQGQNWFIPNQPRQAPERRAPARAPAASPVPAAQTPPLADTGPPDETAPPAPQEQIQVQLPPAPPVPDVPHGTLPPASVIGVLSVPDVLRTSVAYQAADKAIGERRQKLNDDAQQEQVKLRDMGQELATDRSKLSPEQVRVKEKELQDRIAESRRSFTERNRVIQEQGQYALLQIQRTLSEVVQKVAASRGMNLVLQRAEVAVNIPEFDITPEVTEVLNKVLPSVVIPAEGVSPVSTSPVAAAASPTKAAASGSQKRP